MKHSVDHFHANAFAAKAFQPALGRMCGIALSPALRPKPHPDALLHVCRLWNVAPHEAAYVGDSPKDDVRHFLPFRHPPPVPPPPPLPTHPHTLSGAEVVCLLGIWSDWHQQPLETCYIS